MRTRHGWWWVLLATGAFAQAQGGAPRSEPGILEVQRAALRHYRLSPQEVEKLRHGAAWKNLLPVFEVSGGYTQTDLGENTLLYEFSATDPWTTRSAGGQATEVRAKLAWDLPRLMFNSEELDVAAMGGMAENVLREVTRLYYHRRRLLLELALNPPTTPADRALKELRIEEATALLSAMTGGWFPQRGSERGTPHPQ